MQHSATNITTSHLLQLRTGEPHLIAYDQHVRISPGARACSLCEALGLLGGQRPELYNGGQALPAGLDVQPITPQVAVQLQLVYDD